MHHINTRICQRACGTMEDAHYCNLEFVPSSHVIDKNTHTHMHAHTRKDLNNGSNRHNDGN